MTKLITRIGSVAARRITAHRSRHPRGHAACSLIGSASAVAFLAFGAASASGNPVYVDNDAPGGGNGTSWATAFTHLQDALAVATPGDEIRVAGGTYRPDQDEAGNMTPGDRTATFQLKNGVALFAGYAALGTPDPNLRDIVLYETILSGDLAGDDARVACVDHSPDCDGLLGRLCFGGFCIINANNDENGFHVVTGNDTDASAILDGFTITGGNANGQGANGTAGGGMVNVFGSPTVQDCMFSSNSAIGIGGGMYNNSFVFGSSPTVTNCTFSSNFAGEGGGMFNNNYSRPTVTNCVFSDNSAAVNGGGAVNLNNSSPTMERCVFNRNRAARGGGMYNWNLSSPTLRNCMYAGNSVSNQGGAMWNSFSNPAVTNCAFRDNAAGGAGGGMFDTEGSNPAVTNCTFTRNTAVTVGGGMFVSSLAAVPKVTNCILWGNLPTQIHVVHRPPVVNYSIVQGGWSGAGGVAVLNADPLFLDADGPDGIPGTEDDNLRLMSGSPAIDAGDNDAVPAVITTDLDGNPRFVDDAATADTGNPGAPGPPIVDMGAYEFQPRSPCDPCDRILYVDDNASPGGNGSSWATAFIHLQDALAVAAPGDEIRVAGGTYRPDRDEAENVTPGDRAAMFQLMSGVVLYGGYAGLGAPDPDLRDIVLHETILSGDLSGDDAPVPCMQNSPDCNSFGGRCIDGTCIINDNNSENSFTVVLGDGTNATAVLDGFTVTASKSDSGGAMVNLPGSPTVTNCTFSGNSANVGGGMANSFDSSPIVTNCIFRRNFTVAGGGGMWNFNSSPTVANCTFNGNWAADAGAGMANFAGSSPTLSNCTFTGNSAGVGGGMSNDDSSPSVTDCTFDDNVAVFGGGMYNNHNSNPIVRNCTFSGNAGGLLDTFGRGGGMYNRESSPPVTNCAFSGNSADYAGGGMYNDDSDPTVTACSFDGNSAYGDFATNGGGGGIRNDNSSPTLTNCTFTGNSADFGGGMHNQYTSSPRVIRCMFNENTAGQGGGGMGNGGGSNPTVSNCFFNGNSANGSSGGGGMCNRAGSGPTVNMCSFSGNSANGSSGGGGMSNAFDSGSTVNNCTFSGNVAATVGGGMDNFQSSPIVTNCTFNSNSAIAGGAMYNSNNGDPIVVNCILWDNRPAAVVNVDPNVDTPRLNHSNMQGGLPPGTIDGGGNIDADPLFVDPDGLDNIAGTDDDDLRLSPGSPCIDAGDNTAVPASVTRDLLGNRRFFDDSNTDDTGIGAAPIVDMGAYEFGSVPCTSADLDCDGDVDLHDYATWVVCFDATDPHACNPISTPDLDGNDEVDLDDYVLLRTNLTGPGLP